MFYSYICEYCFVLPLHLCVTSHTREQLQAYYNRLCDVIRSSIITFHVFIIFITLLLLTFVVAPFISALTSFYNSKQKHLFVCQGRFCLKGWSFIESRWLFEYKKRCVSNVDLWRLSNFSIFFFSFPAIVKWDSNRLIPYTTCWILFIAVPDWISKKNCWTILVLPDINIASIIRKPHLARRTKPLTVLTWKHPPVHPPLNEPCICLCTLHQYPQFPPSLVHRLVITCSQFLSLSLFRLHITYIFAYRLTFCLPSCANIYIPHKLCLVNISSMIPAFSPTHPSFYILGFSFWSLCVVFSCMPFRVPFVSWIRSFFSICVSPACFSHSLRFPIILLSCVFHIWKT